MGHGHPGVGNLSVPSIATELHDGLDQIANAGCSPRIAMRQQPTVSVDRDAAAWLELTIAERGARSSLGRKAKILGIDQHRDREAVVDQGDIDIATGSACERQSAVEGKAGTVTGQRGSGREMKMSHGKPGSHDTDRLFATFPGAFGSSDHDGGAAIGYG